MTHVMHEGFNSIHGALQLWLGGGPWEVQRQGKLRRNQITNHACLSHLLVSCQTGWTDRCPTPNNEQPNSWWQVGLCVQFSGSVTCRHKGASANFDGLQMQFWYGGGFNCVIYIWVRWYICRAAPRVQLSAVAANGWPHNAPQYHQLMPISCHFWDCKALLF